MSKFIESKLTKTRGTYPPSLKREIAQRYLNGEFSYAVAAEEYGLANKDVVKEFVKWYSRLVASEDQALAERRTELEATGKLPDPASGEPLPDNPAELKRLLEEARGEALTLRTLVQVLKEDFEIDVLKKPVAGSPKK